MLLITIKKGKQFCQNTKKWALWPNDDIAKSIYEKNNILVPQTVK